MTLLDCYLQQHVRLLYSTHSVVVLADVETTAVVQSVMQMSEFAAVDRQMSPPPMMTLV